MEKNEHRLQDDDEINGWITATLVSMEAYMVRMILSMLLFGIIGFTLAYNRIDLKKASYFVIMGCAAAIALVYYFVK